MPGPTSATAAMTVLTNLRFALILRKKLHKRAGSPSGARVMAVRNSGAKAPAVAYLRTSSAANVGDEKDSATRQRLAVERYAAGTGLEIVASFADEAVSG